MPRLVEAGEATASRRRVFFHLTGTDGVTPATSEAGGQPQISTDGGSWTDTGIGTLTHVGNGRYYADLTSGAVATAGNWIETRFKSGSTAECPGDSVYVVSFAPDSVPAEVWASGTRTLTSTGASVTVSSPVPADGGVVRLVAGDDYASADGLALTWTVTTGLDLSAATTNLVIYAGTQEGSGTYLSLACTASAVSGGYTLTRELTAAQTTALASVPRRRYELRATLASSRVRTLASGVIETGR